MGKVVGLPLRNDMDIKNPKTKITIEVEGFVPIEIADANEFIIATQAGEAEINIRTACSPLFKIVVVEELKKIIRENMDKAVKDLFERTGGKLS